MHCESDLLTAYEDMAELSAEMLLAARDGDWESLRDASHEVARMVEALKTLEPLPAPDPRLQTQRFRLLRQLLAQDAELRDLMEPSLIKLEAIINTKRAPLKPFLGRPLDNSA